MIGVGDASMAERMALVLDRLGSEKALIVHGSDGMDELTIAGGSTVWLLEGGEVSTYEVTPEEFGLRSAGAESIRVTSPEDSAEIVRGVLSGETGPARDVVLLNAAAALVAADRVTDIASGVALAADAIDSGAAKAKLDALVELSPSLE